MDEKKEIKKTEKTSELYDLIIEAINDGIWDWDVKSGNAFFSSIYYKILGYENNEFVANYQNWKKLIHEDDLERVEKELQMGINEEKGFNIELRMKTKQGKWLWVATRGKAIVKDKNGKAVRMVGTLTDITEKKQIEEKLKEHTEEMEKMNNLMIGRELEMIRLKERVRELEEGNK